MNYKLFITSIACIFSIQINAQNSKNDSLSNTNFKKFIVPTALMTYGFLSLNNTSLLNLDQSIHQKTVSNNPTNIDDFTMVLPTLSVYGLHFLGHKGKHTFKQKTVLIGTASVINLAAIYSLKFITNRERPNQLTNDAFPSGHTAAAFMGAEFLYQEFKEESIWYGIAGYTVAIGTGYLRMHNNKHWFSDVVAGAGLGIATTKIAYLLYPVLEKKVFKNTEKSTTRVSPFYMDGNIGISFVKSF